MSLNTEIRNATWNKVGIAYNPNTAIFKYAKQYSLGRPVTNEFRFNYNSRVYIVQGYDDAVVFCELVNGNVIMESLNHTDWI